MLSTMMLSLPVLSVAVYKWWHSTTPGRSDTKLAMMTLSGGPSTKKRPIAVYQLLALNYLIFLVDHYNLLPAVRVLYLYHSKPQWFQFLTCAFCHHSWDHLSSNTFLLLIFGQIVELEEGAFALWLAYTVCSVGASLCSFMASPVATVSLGASGAVYGLFATAVLMQVRLSWRSLLSAFVLGQFVVQRVWQEVLATASGGVTYGGVAVGHLAHLGGAATGALLMYALSRLASSDRPPDANPGMVRGTGPASPPAK